MNQEQLKQAIISVLIGAVTIMLVNLLQGLLHILNEWIANGAGGTVAAASYLIQRTKV